MRILREVLDRSDGCFSRTEIAPLYKNLGIAVTELSFHPLVSDEDRLLYREESIRAWRRYLAEAPNDPQAENFRKIIAESEKELSEHAGLRDAEFLASLVAA